MNIVSCSSCGAKFRAPDGSAGKRFKCPKCGSAIAVEAASGDAEAAPATAGLGATVQTHSATVHESAAAHAGEAAPPAAVEGAPLAAPPPGPPVLPGAAQVPAGPAAPTVEVIFEDDAQPAVAAPPPPDFQFAAPAADDNSRRRWVLIGAGIGAFLVLGVLVSAVVWACLAFFGDRITKTNFQKIDDQMPRQEVEALLGKPTRSLSYDRAGAHVVVDAWTNENTAIVVAFRDDREYRRAMSTPTESLEGGVPLAMRPGGAGDWDKAAKSFVGPVAKPTPDELTEIKSAKPKKKKKQ